MTTVDVPNGRASRALVAKKAGEVLANLIGLEVPIPKTTMWRYARQGIVKTVRVGRRYYFQTSELERFVASGGCNPAIPQADV